MIISSPLLVLRKLAPSDLEDFLIYRQDPEVCRFQGFSPFTREQAAEFIQSMISQPIDNPGEWVQVGIGSLTHQRLIGDCALRFRADEPRIAELGITLNPEFQGQGLARKAMELLLHFLEKSYSLHKAVAHIDARNAAARNLLLRLGFTQEGLLLQNFYDPEAGAWIDEGVFGRLVIGRWSMVHSR